MFNTPKMKLPEKHTEVFKTYKNGTPEEKVNCTQSSRQLNN
ncbi:hypothetical protein SACIG1500_1434 [Staphylococcus aureus subsp. aureus CIG1500]|nr:hypothetical protein [Staphylococcus aureus]EHT30718.1 hypothetical protein SACIG1500_1434 [Staphylococcus aureus subsp. aureus CIG1500]